jgi:hypothetical protein
MESFLETLRNRQQDALKRMQVAQQKLQVATAEFQQVQQEFNSWNVAVGTETRRVQQLATENGRPALSPPSQTVASQIAVPEPPPIKAENKTDLVRTFLQHHPTGVTPGDLWQQLKSQLQQRAYLYSVLKRLKDKDEIRVTRGKYYFKQPPQSEEGRSPSTIVQ